MRSREGLGLVVVDYLQLMRNPSNAENRQVEISEISRGLKIFARELKIPVVALSQLSRALETRSDKRPVLADLRESGAIEQDADVVLFINRDEVYNPDTPEKGTAHIQIAKHRNGPVGQVTLSFIPEHARFGNLREGLTRLAGSPQPSQGPHSELSAMGTKMCAWERAPLECSSSTTR